MRTLLRSSLVMSVTVLLIGVPARAWAGTAAPVGFVRLPLAPGEQRLAAMPLHAADAAANRVLAGQLTGSASEDLADRLGKWDSASSVYVFAAKAADTGDAGKDGKWFKSFAVWTQSDLQLRAGDGFVIHNRQNYPQTVLLCGAVPLEAAQTLDLPPLLRLFGSPYATAIRTTDAGFPSCILDSSGSGVTPAELLLGRGYWAIGSETDPLPWIVQRPYGLPVDELDPRLKVQIEPEPGNGAVRLRIAVDGAGDVTVEIMRQHLPEDGRLDMLVGWETAQAALAVKAGEETVWRDTLPATPEAADGFCARVYLVRTASSTAQAQGAEATASGNAATAGAGIEAATAPGGADAATGDSTVSGSEGSDPLPSARTIYVDCAIGDDGRLGLRETVTTLDAPKRTINAALRAAKPGDVISVNAGVYAEEVSFSGVTMVTRGEVVIQ